MNSMTFRTGAAAAVIAGVGVGAAMFGAGQASADVPQCYADQTAVASVDTVDAAATVCRWNDDGSLFYRGVTKSSGDTIDIEVSLVVLTGDGSGRYS
ncbi:hypothetical protein [Gordonia humi]|uniref:Secreted protein n=1 Tax=Gordonia humi TaxID=686429 RepID=A0A840F0P3_9ACTN|nr:hypothetical protein [Gordonia humi]MBB4133930.1 hypothetical protein [Gordonia humi]